MFYKTNKTWETKWSVSPKKYVSKKLKKTASFFSQERRKSLFGQNCGFFCFVLANRVSPEDKKKKHVAILYNKFRLKNIKRQN